MSEKQISYSSRYKKHKNKFPRNSINNYSGFHLSINQHILKNGRFANRTYNRGFLNSAHITGLISKFVGLPYVDLIKEYHKITKIHKSKNFEGMSTRDLDFHFDGNRRYTIGTFTIDDEGLVQLNNYPRKKKIKLTKKQVIHNTNKKIPDFGKVSEKPLTNYFRLYEYNNFIKGFDKPQYLGDYYCIVNQEVLLLPIYHVPALFTDEHSIYNNDENKNDEYTPTFVITKGESYNSSNKLYHNYFEEVDNVYLINRLKTNLIRIEECLNYFVEKNNLERVEYHKMLRDQAQQTLDIAPKRIIQNFGYGLLYPSFKRSDYLKIKNNE